MDRDQILRDGTWRQWIVDQTRDWMYTPYQHKGRIKKVGVDCGGLLYEIYNPLLGPFRPFPEDYSADWSMHVKQELYLDFIGPYVSEVPKPQIGGFSLFYFGLNYSHAGIYIGGGQYVHAYGTNRSGGVRKNGALFFKRHTEKPPKHFDVSTAWLSSLSR